MTGPLAGLWVQLGGGLGAVDHVTLTGATTVLSSVYGLTAFASGTIAAATLAAAELLAVRTGTPLGRVEVDRVHASGAFLSERLLQPLGWELPPVWDPIAGDYRAADGWIRLHTNYPYHRAAALRVLEVGADRDAVEKAVAGWSADELETAVVAAGGCAAVMRMTGQWRTHPHGKMAIDEPPTERVDHGRGVHAPRAALPAGSTEPLAGIKVLDLTRVIAGPVCTRVLAAHGADVLRIDPPGFEEVPALLPDTTVGKRCAALDLRRPDGVRRFETLVREAHVLVDGLRPGALDELGLTTGRLYELNPALIIATLDAYGWRGPWAGRRGFDSLVQMSTGIAARGAEAARVERPTPLPAQALDHGTGYLLAAGVCRALTDQIVNGSLASVRGSLVGAANLLAALSGEDPAGHDPTWPENVVERAETAWGPVRRVRYPGTIDHRRPGWHRPAGPLGRHQPSFAGDRA